MSHAKNELDRVDARYDPENDLIDGAPRVTHTDKVLIDVVKEILEGDDLIVIRAEVLAISKDLFAIKRELFAEDRSSLITTLRAIETQMTEIQEELGLDKLDRIQAVLDGIDHSNFDLLSPELMGEKLEEIVEILAE